MSNFTGKIKVKAKVNETTGNVSYRTVFTNKDQNGDTIFGTMFINFVSNAKNKPVDNDSYIDVVQSFITPRKDNNGDIQWSLVIQDFEYCDNQPTEFVAAAQDDDLPF